jgi:polyisoprenoid-binding protein YceI
MKFVNTLTGVLSLVLWLGCSNPADNVPAAVVSAATNTPADAAKSPDANGQYFAFGPDSASIEFIGSKVTGSHKGGFRTFVGEFKVVSGRLADTENKIVIDINSIWSDNNRVTSHLKTADFFDAGKFPTATFVSTSIDQKAGDSTVTGNLTLHGITKQISFPAKIEVGKEGVNVTAEFFLNRSDFEIKYQGKANDLVRKEVVLKLNVKAAPGRAQFAAY